MSSGTLEDKISALTLLVQESPLHTMKAFENLLGLAKKRSRNQALMAVAALKDLLGQGVVLPGDRKLRPFAKQPGLLGALAESATIWRRDSPLPGGLEKTHLISWAFEDWLKKQYFELLKILETWCGDEVEYARSRAITYVWELLKDKPEQEENLLRLLVNKLGDKDRKIASRTSYLLLQLQNTHPAMKSIVINAIETESLFRPNQAAHAKYYAIITLNQTILGVKEQEVANKLLDIYFSLFLQFLKPKSTEKSDRNTHGQLQRGGGKPGKMAAKKAKAQEQEAEKAFAAEGELREKMVAQVLTGVNRAFPFAKTDDPTFEKQLDTIFKVTHSANFNTSIQALLLIQQISATKHYSADRFYRTLYESLLDPRLLTSSKQIMYLNLLYKSLKSDINVKRVQAFVKRLLQIITMHDPPFVCGVLYLISELETTFPNIRNMIKEAEPDEDDEEEHFVDAPEDDDDNTATNGAVQQPTSTHPSKRYDSRKRDPEHSNADRSALWELLPFLTHFHPSVALFAESLIFAKPMPAKPDPSTHTLMHFLDRFVYRNAKTKASTGIRGSSIMQPMSGSAAADLLIKERNGASAKMPLNSEQFWRKRVGDVAPEEVFFHSYFNQANRTKPKKVEKKAAKEADDEDEEDEEAGEDEIWQALVDSKPDIEGPQSDDDLDMSDLESAYDRSDDDADGGVEIADFPDEEFDADAFAAADGMGAADEDEDVELDDDLPELESGDEDAMFGDDDDLPSDFENEMEAQAAEKEKEAEDAEDEKTKKKNKKRKLKHLPTFASVEDYEKLLGADDDEGY